VNVLRLSDRPQPVRWAVYLLLATSIVGLVVTIFAYWSLLTLVFAFAVIGLVYAIALGRRWAFILTAFLTLSGLIGLPISAHDYLARGIPMLVYAVAATAIDVLAVILLLMPSARRWFTASKAARGNALSGS
jgi:hypothetical protein